MRSRAGRMGGLMDNTFYPVGSGYGNGDGYGDGYGDGSVDRNKRRRRRTALAQIDAVLKGAEDD